MALAFQKSAIQRDINGTGFVVSRNSDYTITACTWTHKKWPHTTPEGKTLLRCYVGRAGDEAVVEQTEEELVQLVLEDLRCFAFQTTYVRFYPLHRKHQT
ncbi:Protoporphyrinogen oxidase [Streptococcus pneumoniae]|nr:Protoporphyrinogen oxidase [Streptococcus pneumoniae]